MRIHLRSFKKSRCLQRPPDQLIPSLGGQLGHHYTFVLPGDYNRTQSCKPCSLVVGEIPATFPRWRLPGRFRLDVRRQEEGFPGAHARSVTSPPEPSSRSPASILFADAGDSGSGSISGLAKGAAAARKGARRAGVEQNGTRSERRRRKICSRSRCGQVGSGPERLGLPLR